MKAFIFIILLCGLIMNDVLAFYDITPEIHTDEFPDIFATSNDLTWSNNNLQDMGQGEKMVIYGIIKDANDVPVSDAVMRIWHSYAQQCDKVIYNNRDLCKDDIVISGTTHSNNAGEYSFITFFPNANIDHAAYINSVITHSDFLEFQTKIFMPSERETVRDKQFMRLPARAQNKLFANYTMSEDQHMTKGRKKTNHIARYRFDINLGGRNLHKQY